jgi:hypothetical protein
MRKPRSRYPNEQGVALVTTVIVVAMLAVVGVALMQSTAADRASSRSVANYTRAQLAAEAGVGMAGALLAMQMTNDHFIVVANTNRQIFVGNGSNQPAGSFAYTPTFSTVNSVTSAVTPLVTNGIPVTNPPAGPNTTNFTFTNLPGGLSATSPPAISWVYLTTTNAAGQAVTNARFAFWVEDLAGKLDLSVVGTTDSTVGRRPTGTNPAEIALWSVFNPGVNSDVANPTAGALINARSNILTAATARLVNAAVTTDILAEFAANLRHDTNEPELIPFGFGYADQGKAKYDLNTNTAAAGVGVIAGIITGNLRNPTNGSITFASTNRSGGMAGDRYVNAIAASMVDYVDSGNLPTSGGSGATAYRGIEGLPFVTETATAIQWMAHGTNITGFGGKIADEIHVENYVELWNSTDKAFSGKVGVSFVNDYACGSVNGFPIDLRITNSSVNSSVLNTSGFSLPDYEINVVPPLEPNEYRAFSLGTNVYRFVVSATPTTEPNYANGKKANAGGLLRLGRPTDGLTDSFSSTLRVRYGGGDYDRVANIHRVGNRTIYCKAFSSGANALPDWAGNVPALRMTPTDSPAVPGDPRMGFYLTTTNNAQGYASTPANPGSSMGFRNNGLSSGGTPYNNDPSRWLDGGFTNSPLRTAVITDSNRPPTNRQTTSHTNDFVQRLNDTGSWTNILELGHIFDPMAWNAPVGSGAVTTNGMPAAGNASTTVTFGGGNTLRIGRAEHPRFTNDGLRASQLLDLFAVGGPKVGTTVVSRMPGRININTASTNVLRALAAGVQHANEPSLRPANLIVPVAAVSNFVTSVTNFRESKPFFATSQLNLISTNMTNAASWANGTVFGRTNLLGVTAWGDRSAEEWFSRIYPLSTVRSRNFVVYVVGQSVASNTPTVPQSVAKKAFQIYVDPTPFRGANGLTTNNVVKILGSWDL